MQTQAALAQRRFVWACSVACAVGILVSTAMPAHACDRADQDARAGVRLVGEPDHEQGVHRHVERLSEQIGVLQAELEALRATLAERGGRRVGVGPVPPIPAVPPVPAVPPIPPIRAVPPVLAVPPVPTVPPVPPISAVPHVPGYAVAPQMPPMPEFGYVGGPANRERIHEWREHMREWDDQWREKNQEMAERWREFADEWRERQQDFADEWRQRQREFTDEWRERQREFTEQWRERQRDLGEEWQERQHHWREQQHEWQERFRDRTHSMAERVREKAGRVREKGGRQRERGAKQGKGARRGQREADKAPHRVKRGERAVYQVTGKQADALYSLLVPDHVKVIVSHAGENIAVLGSSREHEVLNAALQLLNWIDRDEVFDRMRQGEQVDRQYKVGKKRSQRLFKLLAPNEVKVVVLRANKDAVIVSATEREHEVLRDFLNLLGWKRKKG